MVEKRVRNALPVSRSQHTSWLDRCHSFAYTLDHTASFVPQDAREQAFGIMAIERVNVSVLRGRKSEFKVSEEFIYHRRVHVQGCQEIFTKTTHA